MMEPAAYGASVMFGPHIANFRETVEQLLKHNAARQVADAEELTRGLLADLDDPESAAARAQPGEISCWPSTAPPAARSPSSTAWLNPHSPPWRIEADFGRSLGSFRRKVSLQPEPTPHLTRREKWRAPRIAVTAVMSLHSMRQAACPERLRYTGPLPPPRGEATSSNGAGTSLHPEPPICVTPLPPLDLSVTME